MSTPTIKLETNSAEQTVQLGQAIGRCCAAKDILALQGELGAGKTQLVRGLAIGMGLNPRQVSSPTFVMAQEYEPNDPSNGTPVLVHIDAYRIQSPEELESIGWEGQGEELRAGAVVAIEWAKLIRPAIGDDYLWIEIEHATDGRRVTLTAFGDWAAKMHAIATAIDLTELNIKKIER